MKKIHLLIIVAMVINFMSCTNPLKGLKLYVNNNLYSYTITLHLQDATTGDIVTNTTITIGGTDAPYVLDRDGKTKFLASSGGSVDFSISPLFTPSTTQPISFYINISAPNYLPVTKQVVITSGNAYTSYTLNLVNLSAPPHNMHSTSRSLGFSSGHGTSKPSYAGGRTTSGSSSLPDSLQLALDQNNTSVFLPAGTTFHYYTSPDGSTITGARATPLTHDSTSITGLNSIIYRPISGYYQSEFAQFSGTGFTPTTYTNDAYGVTVVMIFRNDTNRYPFSIYSYTGLDGGVNHINTLNSGSGVSEDNLLLQSCVKERLVDLYFVGSVNGQLITLSPDSNKDWFISYVVDSTITNPHTGHNFKLGDVVETGINYTPGSYPIIPIGGSFTSSTLNTLKDTIFRDAIGVLKVNSQSFDAGIYQTGTSTTYSYTLNANVDTSQIPDPENLFGYANINLTIGSTVSHFPFYIYPGQNLNVTGTVTSTTGSASINGTVNVYYWDSLIRSTPATNGMQVFGGFNIGSTYNAVLSGKPVMYPDNVRFNYNWECPSNGTAKVIQPTYNGTFLANLDGKPGKLNCNMRTGHWQTRGVKIGTIAVPDTITGSACNYSFTPIIITNFNSYNTNIFNDKTICNCYFH